MDIWLTVPVCPGRSRWRINLCVFWDLFSSTVNGLQGRVDNLEKSNTKLIEEVRLQPFIMFALFRSWHVIVICVYVLCICFQLAIAKNNIIKLQEENQQLRSENSLILLKAKQHLEVSRL